MPEVAMLQRLADLEIFPEEGHVSAIAAGEVEAIGPDLPIGAHCELIAIRGGHRVVEARVVGVTTDRVKLVPFGSVENVRIGDIVRRLTAGVGVRVGDDFCARAIDALGKPLDGKSPPKGIRESRSIVSTLDRIAPHKPVPTGIRAIDGLLTLGQGARIGVFAASGVGKTRLIEQLLRQVECRRIIVCLVGERGREVETFWRHIEASSLHARTTLVAATSDESAPMRAQAVEQALALAEYWRGKGEDVLLLVDSATRYAMALREIGLVAGEPPTVRAYTPGVFRELPRIVERCGARRQGGSITAIFTVLSESDDVDDPIVEVMKSLLDGHIILSRKLAQIGHYPAIDVGQSVSRLFDSLADAQQRKAAVRCRALIARYEEARILIESGMYKAGGDPELDLAVRSHAEVNGFLRQADQQGDRWETTRSALIKLAEAA